MGRVYTTAIKIGATVAKSLRTDTLAGAEALKKLSAEAKKLDATAKAAGQLADLGGAAAAARAKVEETAAAARKLAEEAKAAGKPTDDLKQRLAEAKVAARTAATELRQVDRAAAKAGAVLRAAGVDTSKLADEQQRLTVEATRSARALATVEAAEKARTRLFGKRREDAALVDRLGDAWGRTKDRAASLARDGVLVLGGAAAAAAVPLQRYAQFQRGMAEASTLVEDKAKLPELTKQVRALSVEFGSPHVQTASALWTILSAGVQDTAKATDVLRVSQKLSVGGSVDVKKAATGIASAVNAYKDANLGAADAADILFTASKIGMASPESMAEGLGRVTPIAAEAGVTFQEVGAAIGAITTVMPSTDEAVTELRGILSAVLKPTKQARDEARRLGIDFSVAALKSKGFAGFIRELATNQKFTGDSAAKLFGRVEALNAIMFLGKNNAATLTDALSQMEKRGGSVDNAFGEMSGTLDRQWQRAKAQADDVAITLGERLAPAAGRALSRLSAYITANGDKIQAWADRIGVWIETRAVPAFEAFVPRVVALVSGVAAGVEKVAGWVGGWENLGVVLLALRFAPLVSSIFSVGSALAQTTIALVGYIAKLVAARAAQEALAGTPGIATLATKVAPVAGVAAAAAGAAGMGVGAGLLVGDDAYSKTGGAVAGGIAGALVTFLTRNPKWAMAAAAGTGAASAWAIDAIGNLGNREKSAGSIDDMKAMLAAREAAMQRAQLAMPTVPTPGGGTRFEQGAIAINVNGLGPEPSPQLTADLQKAIGPVVEETLRRHQAEQARRSFK